jgi:hypothetical protein
MSHVFKIRNGKTGLFLCDDIPAKWNKTGHTWFKIGALMAWLRSWRRSKTNQKQKLLASSYEIVRFLLVEDFIWRDPETIGKELR